MKRKNKIKRFATKFAEPHVKIGKKCLDCKYSDKPTIACAILRCTCHKPKVIFHPKVGWICFCFSEKNFVLNEVEDRI